RCSLFLTAALVLALSPGAHGHAGADAGAGLSSSFYDDSCPGAGDIVRRVIQKARVADARIPASLIRLHFHDCFVQGCDGSLLLDNDLPAIMTEKEVPANDRSARGFKVVDDIKRALENACPGIVSCADILALASEISVELAGGPRWSVLLGRRDGTTTNIESANNLPSPFDSLEMLQEKFKNLGLDDTDLVALQGAHTFGRAQCQFTQHLPHRRVPTFNPFPVRNSSQTTSLKAELQRRAGRGDARESRHSHPRRLRQQVLRQPLAWSRPSPVGPGNVV
uniref:Plant heme peroxidase family profile domain-containing protein n=1 Tax=Aegilops tauschii subsp. strangulata TaxID=200361 RepID=A0A453G8H2_AEGTS